VIDCSRWVEQRRDCGDQHVRLGGPRAGDGLHGRHALGGAQPIGQDWRTLRCLGLADLCGYCVGDDGLIRTGAVAAFELVPGQEAVDLRMGGGRVVQLGSISRRPSVE
jgi:hypothetical protein